MPTSACPPTPAQNGTDAVGKPIHSDRIGSVLRFADSDGIGAFAVDAALRFFGESPRRPQCVLPGC